MSLEKSPQPVEVCFRVPGPWKRVQELVSQLPTGFRVERGFYVTRWGSLELQVLPPDRELPRIFRMACRRPLSPAEGRGLDKHAAILAVIGRAGSLASAQSLLKATAGLIQAGGIGIFIDNCLAGHSGTDWMELAEHAHDPQAVFYVFITLAMMSGAIRSHGMHIFGQRDAIAGHNALTSIEDFLRMSAENSTQHQTETIFIDQQGHEFKLHVESDDAFLANQPLHNPFGRWRLERS